MNYENIESQVAWCQHLKQSGMEDEFEVARKELLCVLEAHQEQMAKEQQNRVKSVATKIQDTASMIATRLDAMDTATNSLAALHPSGNYEYYREAYANGDDAALDKMLNFVTLESEPDTYPKHKKHRVMIPWYMFMVGAWVGMVIMFAVMMAL